MLSSCALSRRLTDSIRLYSTRGTKSAPPGSQRPPIAVDDLCIPLEPPYSIASYIPEPKPLSRETLTKLHRLSALEPPKTEAGWRELEQLGGLAAIIEGVRLIDTSAVVQDGVREHGGLVDGRVRGQSVELQSGQSVEEDRTDGFGRELLELAEVKDGAYYTVPTPENVRGKRRSNAGASS